jgi:hypothetical protein
VSRGRRAPDVGCCKYSFPMLRMLSFDVVDMWCWGPDVGCCRQHGSQHGSLEYCARGGGPLMLDVACNTLVTWLQHCSLNFRSNDWRLSILGSNGCKGVRH